MKALFAILLGYTIGSVSPSAIIGRMKKTDLRADGTKNLGATNTMLHFGKGYGALVMLLDMLKSILAVMLAAAICPEEEIVGIVGGSAAVVGHIFPFYMKFKGGKGLATFGGLVLAVNPPVFLFLLILSCLLMVIVNYSFIMPYSAGILFPILHGAATGSPAAALIAAAVSGVILFKHRDNVVKAWRGEDIKIREFLAGKYKTGNK